MDTSNAEQVSFDALVAEILTPTPAQSFLREQTERTERATKVSERKLDHRQAGCVARMAGS
jgi:hypothetical protein